MTEDLYVGFAERYDLFYGSFGEVAPSIVAFFESLFGQFAVHSVLDCACGTGRHLPMFHALGCEVMGSDISASMLAQARKNLNDIEMELPLHRVDYRFLPQHFDRQFDAVTCLSSSILHMPSEEEVLRALASMRRVLRDGGLLILTQGTTDKQWREQPRFLLAVNSRDFSRLFVIDYLDAGARYNVLDVFHSEDADELKIWSVDYPHVYLRDDQERLLRAAGFEAIAFYGNYRFEPYDAANSDQVIAVAEK
jgi:glycine/sarcosine N-methyltransferase